MEGRGREEGEERMCAVGIFNYFMLCCISVTIDHIGAISAVCTENGNRMIA